MASLIGIRRSLRERRGRAAGSGRWLLGVAALAAAACRSGPPAPADEAPSYLQARVAGTLALEALHAPVQVVRDRWGVPHIDAQSEHDLFVAQGFVQAEDRLFQMDLWRRSVQGRLSEVLGANFVERDAMTRRVQYRGDRAADWAASPPGSKAIAEAFVAGINAWVARARERLPEPFVLAGWKPEFWQPDDLLNRTDAFLASGDALDEVLRARMLAAAGPDRAKRLPGVVSAPDGLDLATISPVIADALRRVGTAPFFVGLAAPVAASADAGARPGRGGSNVWAIAPRRTGTGAAVLASDPHRALAHPSLWYLVHLHAPGWDVAGAAVPWLPGVVMGHNTRIAWGFASRDADVEDLYVERTNPADARQIRTPRGWTPIAADRAPLAVRGRAKPIEIVREMTPHGVIVASDRTRHLVFALRWTGFEPGTAGMLGALAVDRAQSWPEFRRALAWWKAPAVTFAYADRDGVIATQAAGLVPARRGWDGRVPAPGWSGTYEWRGWRPLDALPPAVDPRDGFVVDANGSVPRTSRIREAIGSVPVFGAQASAGLQHNVRSWTADRLVPRLEGLRGDAPAVEAARGRLVAWNRELTTGSEAATLYVLWEEALKERVAARVLDPALAREYVAQGLGPDVADSAADADLLPALSAAVQALSALAVTRWGAVHRLTFVHPLAVTDAARRRFDVGPFEVPGDAETVMATSGRGLAVSSGPSFRQVLDLSDWDRAVVSNAPGQSESPASPHFADLARIWAAGREFPLPFTDTAIAASAEATLRLVPAATSRR